MNSFDARIGGLNSGEFVLSMAITPSVDQHHGGAHAGATFPLGDSTSGYAALGMMPEGAEVMTVEMRINPVAPPAGRCLSATPGRW